MNNSKHLIIILILLLISIHLFIRIDESLGLTWSTPLVSSIPDNFLSKESGSIHSNITFWSSDFHISPVEDVKSLLHTFGVKVIDKSLSGHCHLMNTCATNLKIVNQENGIQLEPCPNYIRNEFFQNYFKDSEFNQIDAVLCTHAASMCELFMPFNKNLVVLVSTRFEIGRHSKIRWLEWIDNLSLIASKNSNFVAANNHYDLEYLRYFTGIRNILYLPNYCGYVSDVYNPTRVEVLLAPARGVHSKLVKEVTHASLQFGIRIAGIRQLYPEYRHADIASHRAIVLLPYQVSFMSFFEYYKMGIPMFAPTPDLLTDWHMEHGVLSERTWPTVFGSPAHKSVIPRHVNSTSALRSDPNDEFNRTAVLEWTSLSDYYKWPHITLFHSFDHLMELLRTSNLTHISRNMARHSRDVQAQVRSVWSHILSTVLSDKKKKYGLHKKGASSVNSARTISLRQGQEDNLLEPNINVALKDFYNIELNLTGCTGSIPLSFADHQR